MLDSQLTLTYAGTPITLDRINQDNYGSEYFGEITNGKVKLSVKHTIPPRGQANESHLVRLDVEHYSAEGAYLRTSSAWTVIKTFDGVQVAGDSEDAFASLRDLMADPLLAKVVGRQS